MTTPEHHAGAADSILPPNWIELAPLIDTILDAPPDQRIAVLTDVSGGDPVRRATLEQLLMECERDMPMLDGSALEHFTELLDEPETPLPAVLSGRYQIGRELGRGGMARVYLARDLKHNRDVALKVIRPELAASLGRELFLREIEIAARFRHPNIVPLYDSGDDGGALYFVMPFETGPSLREVLGPGPLAIAEAVRVLRDVARALEYAHEQGVVHRDVKPDNVMLSHGAAVVADFGIARAVRVAQADAPAVPLGQTSVIGTPAYMSPEQATGDPATDHRADIYSFGCMAYELFAGRPPFQGDSADALIAAHAGTMPPPVSELRDGMPHELVLLIARCLEKNPAARPQNAAELVAALDHANSASNPAAPRVWRTRVLIVLATLLTAGLALAGYSILKRGESLSGPVTLAVLPLWNSGGDSTQALLAAGLSDEIADALVRVPWVRVMSRGGVSNYDEQRNIDYQKTGRDLGARFMLTGSLRTAGAKSIIALTLIRAADGSVLWSDVLERSSADLEAMRDEIARSTADALRPIAGAPFASTGAQRSMRPAERRTNGDAYYSQVQAQRWLDQRGQSVRPSAEYFRRAIALDSLYAKAYSGLSLALALYPYFQNARVADVRDELVKSAQRALALDSTLAQPHIALAMAYQHDLQWDRADAEFSTALRLDRHDVEARVQYGRHLLFRGRTAEGLRQFQAAREDDPASALVLSWVSYAYYLERQQDSARVISERALRSNAVNFTSVLLGSLVRLGEGRLDEARQLIGTAPPDNWIRLYVFAATGDTAGTRQHVQALLNRRPPLSMAHTIHAYAMLGLGDTARALDALEAATNANEIWPSIQPETDRMFDRVRESARFRALLRRVGLAP